MARWQFTKDELPTADPIYDDGGGTVGPGEEGFSTDLVKQNLPPGATGFNYVGDSR